jgi:diaminopimelate decarboxylase
MAYFYKDSHLHIGQSDDQSHESLDLFEFCQRFEEPVYIYDLDHILSRFQSLKNSFKKLKPAIHYAMKANSNASILAALGQSGAGVDTVSAGEIKIALAAGIPSHRIIFSGVGKTKAEIRFAIAQQIKQINVESPAELRRIIATAQEMQSSIDVAFRMNPDVNPQTHPYITTGFRENKFGMDESFLPELLEILKTSAPWVRLRGLTLHIGSQLLELDSLREAISKTVQVFLKLRTQGFTLDRFDVGGGVGLDYKTHDESLELELVARYGPMVEELLEPLQVEVMLEPGRLLVGRSGLLVSQVQYIKSNQFKNFIIVNTGMHHLLRPALYQAQHRILPLLQRSSHHTSAIYDVVGPICESSDVLTKNLELSKVQEGDLLAIADTGAYGFSMASHYNAHSLPLEFVISKARPLIG